MHAAPPWLTIERRDAGLIVSSAHTGTAIPPPIAAGCASPWLARKDADCCIAKRHGCVRVIGATVVHPPMSGSVIDVNRDPAVATAAASHVSSVVTGRCKGGYTTQRFGAPVADVDVLRGSMKELIGPVGAECWPYDEAYCLESRARPRAILVTCPRFAKEG